MARPLSSNSTSMTSKEYLFGYIKQHFDQETENCRERDRNPAPDVQVNPGDAIQLQDQLRRLKRRCAKLERKLEEKEADKEQQQLDFPLLMHETMRSLRSLENNQSDRAASASPLSHSVISSMAHEKIDVDARIHEYEQQIAKLYEENQQEKLNNEMLNECLREQKHAKAKLMKACKHVKQELQAVKDSGLSQMLVDMEARCDALEKEKARITEALLAERSLRAGQELQQQTTAKQLEELILESTKWEGIISRKNDKLQRSRDQICEQQLTIENLKADLKSVEQRFNRPRERYRQEEAEQLIATISVQRTKHEEAQRELQRLQTENDFLREQLAFRHEGRVHGVENSSCGAQETYENLLIQVRFIKKRLRALKELVQVYEETSIVDINLLDEDDPFHKVLPGDDTLVAHSCGEFAMQLSGSVLEATRYVSELQQVVEDASAHLMGSTCALQ
ncbi:hypothetical protein GN244_ATG05563 [Phytophthora infestans]|uniref:Uncharacterized protein n=1 Tax=Phytophthora infestans TaxID=4787 RepID=A0A833SJY9_PHYIN|nr:hypothetical protein GN244_ATG05563 [Phytophthora infestans]KAF4137940.1 hypothetical protein GN958_ATG12893 [Phytophthora infestans]